MGAIHYLAIAIGVFFIYVGVINLIPVNPIPGFGHEESKVAFTRAASVSPLKAVGLVLSPTMLRSVIGIMDVSSGSLMAFGRYPYRILATLELLTILLLGIYCELILGGSFAISIPPTIGCLAILWFHQHLKCDRKSPAKGKQN